MTPPYADTFPAAPARVAVEPRHRWPRRGLLLALVASLAVHLVMSLWPVEIGTSPEDRPLQATITELPPPPAPAPAAVQPKPKPKPKRAPPAPVAAPEPAPAVAEEAPAPEPAAEAPPTAMAETPAPVQETASVDSPPIAPEAPPKALPPRLDLAYKVYLGTQGFLVGEATYRFEHSGNRYKMATVGEARGLAALLIRGQGRIESQGLITPTGLQPQMFAVERGSRDRREVATFDWEAGIVTLHEQQTAPLELSTFDPLSVMWQFYFSPPTTDEISFSVATTRRVFRYTVTRERTEKVEWGQGEIDADVWHRRSDDGKTDSYIWLAPSLHNVPVKLRVVATNRGTLEALLDSMRIDEPPALQ